MMERRPTRRRSTLLLAIVLSACGASSPPAEEAAAPKPAPAPPKPAGQLYQQGKPFTPSRDEGGDRYTCRATVADEEACRTSRGENVHCVLEPPVGYWEGELRCSGVRMDEWEMERAEERVNALPIPACECGCADAHMRAAEAFRARLDECAQVP